MDVASTARARGAALFSRRFSPLNDVYSSPDMDGSGPAVGGSQYLLISVALVFVLLGLFGSVSLFVEYGGEGEQAARQVCLDRCERGLEAVDFSDEDEKEDGRSRGCSLPSPAGGDAS